jgi:hypothetical protein
VHGLHAATSKVVNSAQGSSCKLKFVHGRPHYDGVSMNTEKKFYNIDEMGF